MSNDNKIIIKSTFFASYCGHYFSSTVGSGSGVNVDNLLLWRLMKNGCHGIVKCVNIHLVLYLYFHDIVIVFANLENSGTARSP